MELDLCVRAIERRANYPVSVELRAQHQGPHAAESGAVARAVRSRSRSARIWTIRGFDDRYTAPLNGFGDASNYYQQASSRRVVERIRVPALILTAADDPFVPP